MTCAEAHEALLDADLTTLKGTGDEPLAHHIRACTSCAMRARIILQGEESLAKVLTTEGYGLDLDKILDASGLAPSGVLPPLPTRWRARALAGHGLRLLPVAAAAALAALFLVRGPSLPGPAYSPPASPPGLDVQTPEGSSVAVLETNNPNITVLWLF